MLAPTPPVATSAAPERLAPAAPAAPRESSRIQDERWLRARDADPLEKERLAVAVGAAGLLAGLDDGGDTADTALLALPYADDAEVALGHLAALARADPGRRRRVLAAILGIAGRPPHPRDPLDLEGARRCADVMILLASDPSVPRDERAFALSAARALAERDFVDRARVPGTIAR
jgi:hypothetical protein